MSSTNLQRGLTARQAAMIALGGSIGTGIFLSSGHAIAMGGPGGALLAFTIIGLMIYFLMTSLGEMAALYPITGTFCEYCTRFVDPALGFSMSYNYWFNWAITVAADLSAAAIVMQFWFPHIPSIYWSAFFFCLILVFNLFSVGVYGEIEFYFSSLKIITVIIFIIIGILMIFGLIGNHLISYQNWIVGDAPFHNGWHGLLAVLLVAGFSFQGTEIFGVTAGELKNAEGSIPKIIKNIFWRILLFYVITIAIISCIISYQDPALVNESSDIHLSPFTIVFKEAGFKFAASILNIIILTAILSAANASMYTATRTLWYMSKKNIAPQFFSRLTPNKVPIWALLCTALIGAMTFLSSFIGGGTLFIWLVHVSSLSGFIAWLGIAISHYRFRKAYILQGHQLKNLPFQAKWFPFGPLLTLFLCLFIIIGQELTNNRVTWTTLLSTYFNLFLFIVMYFGYKFYYRTKLVSLHEKSALSLDQPSISNG